jgi:type 1 glutamine amidotransferase
MKTATSILSLWCLVAALVLAWGGPVTGEQDALREPESTLVPVPDGMREKLPPPRSREEVRAVLGEEPAEAAGRPVHVVLVAGPKDHGPGEHDYPAWQKAWQKLLSQAPRTRVTTAWEKPGDDDFKSADVLVFFKHKAWPREVNEQIDAFLARGGGIVLLHFAVDGGDNGEHVGKHLGLYWGPGARFRHGHLDLEFEDRTDLPFLKGLAGRKLHFHDESYWRLTGDPSRIDLLASAMEDDGDGRMVRIPLIWNRENGKGPPLRSGGRIHVNILGHYNWTFNDPLFRILVLRGIAWAAGEQVDRFAPVVMTDVPLKD